MKFNRLYETITGIRPVAGIGAISRIPKGPGKVQPVDKIPAKECEKDEKRSLYKNFNRDKIKALLDPYRR